MSARKDQTGGRRRQIIREAIRLADEKGLDGLSMRNLASRLGIVAMSLYNHISDKEDLLDEMTEAVLAGCHLTEIEGNWREQMRLRAISLHACMMEHPWFAGLYISRLNLGPEYLNRFNAALGCLYNSGLSYEECDGVLTSIDSHILGFSLQRIHFPISSEEYSNAADTFSHLAPADELPHMYALTKIVQSGEYSGVVEFEFGLELILDAIARRYGI